MPQFYLPIFEAIITLIITVLIYDFVQSKLAVKAKTVNVFFNIFVITGLFVLIGVVFYLLIATAIYVNNGSYIIFKDF